MIDSNRFDAFAYAMSIPAATAVYSARVCCFARRTLPRLDVQHLNIAVKEGIVFG